MTYSFHKSVHKQIQLVFFSTLLLVISCVASNAFAQVPPRPKKTNPQSSVTPTVKQDRSLKSTKTSEVCVKFSNSGTVPLQLVWVGYDAVEVPMGILEPGKPQEFFGLEKQLFRIKQGNSTISEYVLTDSSEQSHSAKVSTSTAPRPKVAAGSPPRRKTSANAKPATAKPAATKAPPRRSPPATGRAMPPGAVPTGTARTVVPPKPAAPVAKPATAVAKPTAKADSRSRWFSDVKGEMFQRQTNGAWNYSVNGKAAGTLVESKRTPTFVELKHPDGRLVHLFEGTMTLVNIENGQQIEGFRGGWSTPVSATSRKTTVWRSSDTTFVKNADGTWTGSQTGSPDHTFTVIEETTHLTWLENKKHKLVFRLHHGIATISDDQSGSYVPIMKGTWIAPQLRSGPVPDSVKGLKYPLQIK